VFFSIKIRDSLVGLMVQCCAQFGELQSGDEHPLRHKKLLYLHACHLQKPFVVHMSTLPQHVLTPSEEPASQTTYSLVDVPSG
jgi:hypothetical protein